MSNPPTKRKSDEEWLELLSPEEYRVARQGGTERPFTGEYNQHTAPGVFHCRCCDTALFSSEEKFDAGCGWPSFSDHMHNDALAFLDDNSHGMRRIEVRCRACDAHLGHVFPDGPTETGQRYCINSVCLRFSGAET